jgi:hypothetical protein
MWNRGTSVSYRPSVAAKDTMTSAAVFAGTGACQRTTGKQGASPGGVMPRLTELVP